MAFFDELDAAGISDDERRAWTLTAYYPTQAQLGPLSLRLGLPGKCSPEWFKRHTSSLFAKIAAPARRAALRSMVRELGLDDEVLGVVIDSERGDDEGPSGNAELYLGDVHRQGLLGALYWGYRAHLARHPVASDAGFNRGFSDDILAQRFGLPGVILLGDGNTRYGRAGDGPPSLATRYDPIEWGPHTDPLNEVSPQPELQDWLGWALWARGWAELGRRKRSGRSAWNGSLARLVRITQGDDENTHELHLQPTTYVAQLSTSFAWKVWKQWAFDAGSRERRGELIHELEAMIDIRERELEEFARAAANADIDPKARAAAAREAAHRQRDIGDLREAAARLGDVGFPDAGPLQVAARERRRMLDDAYAEHQPDRSRLANALSTNVTIVSSDGWFYLQRRNAAQVGEGLVDWQTTGAGFVNAEKDLDSVGAPSIWLTMAREAREEFGWELWAPALGVFWEGRKREVGVLALARSARARADIQVPIVETTEVLGFRPTWFEPATVFRFMVADRIDLAGDALVDAGAAPRMDGTDQVSGPWANVMPLGAASIIFSLANTRGGTPDAWVELAREFTRARRRGG